MRHRISGRKLGRTGAHRKAMFRNQLTALFTHERITTTLAKAKELRPIAERMVTLARTGTLPARRKVLTWVPDKDVVGKLFEDIAPRFAERPGGYTRVLRLGRRRGDGAELAIIEFVDFVLEDKGGEPADTGKRSFMDRAKGMLGGRTATAETEPEPGAEAEVAEEAEAAAGEAEAAEEPTETKKKKKARRKAAAESDTAGDEGGVEESSGEAEAEAEEK